MAQPTKYTRAYSFEDFQTAYPSQPVPAVPIDNEYDAVASSIAQIIQNLAIIQRDDGGVQNASIGIDQLDATTRALIGNTAITPAGGWITAHDYALLNLATFAGASYLCAVAHTSGVFATDLAAGKWVLFANPVAAAGSSFFQEFNGTGAQTVFTLSQNLGTDPNALMIFVGANAPLAPTLEYTLSGTTLTFAVAPALGVNNVKVYAPSLLAGVASSSAAAALVSQNAAAASAVSTAADAVSTSASAAVAVAAAATAVAAQSTYTKTGTSVSTVTVGTGSKAFVTQTGIGWIIGASRVRASTADGSKIMEGQLTGYSAGSATINVDYTVGAGSSSAWNLTDCGSRGASGAGSGDVVAANFGTDYSAGYGTLRQNIGVKIGTDVQAWDADLDALAGLTYAADKIPYFTGAHAAAVTSLTSVARTLIAQTTQALMRTTGLGLGTVATLDVGTGANNIVQRDGSGNYPAGDGSAITNVSAGPGRLLNTIYCTQPTTTFTITIASPGVITFGSGGGSVNAAGLNTLNAGQTNQAVVLSTTGALPTGLVAGTVYYLLAGNKLSATSGGAAINTSGSQSGTHTIKSAPFVKGTNNPSFIIVEGVNSGDHGGGVGTVAGSYFKKKILNAALGSSEIVDVAKSNGGSAGVATSFGTAGALASTLVADIVFGGQLGNGGNSYFGGGIDAFNNAFANTGAAGQSTTPGGSGILIIYEHS